jgi:hyperosmotically inducible protein
MKRAAGINPDFKRCQQAFMLANEQTVTARRWMMKCLPKIMDWIMRLINVTSLFVIGALLAPVVCNAADSDTDRIHPITYVKDSAITAKIKAKLAVDHAPSLIRIQVDTDKAGVVWLSGEADSQEAVDEASSIARGTEGVVAVKSDIKIRSDR